MLLLCWSLVTAFNREIRAYQKAQRRAFRDHIGEYYGLEVESSPPAFHLPKVRWPHPKRPGQRAAKPPAIMPEAPAITSPTGDPNSDDHPEAQRTDI
jgi:choline/glycine/proline betaine transport protein